MRKASASFVTKRNADTVTVTLSNGDSLSTVTPDHLVMLRSGEYVEAGTLRRGDELETICRSRRGWRYLRHQTCPEPNRPTEWSTEVLYEGVHGRIPDGYDIDHINQDHHDNRIDNLRAIPHGEHASLSRSVPNDRSTTGTGSSHTPATTGGSCLPTPFTHLGLLAGRTRRRW